MKNNLKIVLRSVFIILLLFIMIPILFGDDLLDENTFENGTIWPWHVMEDSGGVGDFEWRDGELVCQVIEAGENAWSVQVRHRGLTIEQGHTYNVKFKLRATKSVEAFAKIGMMDTPYAEYWNNNGGPFTLPANEWVIVDQTFTMNDATDNTCEFTFHLGGPRTNGNAPYEIEFDDIYLEDPGYIKPVIPEDPALDIKVNQVGYFPKGVKKASAAVDSNSPVEWNLVNANDTVVASGLTEVYGFDNDSGDNVHIIDFSSFDEPGVCYKLVLPTISSDNNYSHEFDIRNDLYSQLKYDALAYFYHNRSGIAIEMPYAGREDLTRAAGHVDVDPNTGDGSVPTWPDTGQASYSKDVIGGWYDAGDHGKYVVNGGISLWTMLNQYERIKYIEGADLTPFDDGMMMIPENDNGLPDILDEAKWEMDFMLKMQITESEDSSLAGMVHHKIHDEAWTAIPMAPADDPQVRYLRPVSTAATLNLGATAAQAYRIWRDLDDDAIGEDDEYANKCLTAAEKAWIAALANPDIYAPLNEEGGGPYNDNYLTDEFYWAAAELYISTGKSEYEDYIKQSPHYLQMTYKLQTSEDEGLTGAFTWGSTYGLGTVSLSLVPNNLETTEIETAKQNIYSTCDEWLNIINEQGYRLPILPAESDGQYPWGSNSFILNIMVVMAYAYDYSNDIKYFNGITESLDYILGRNSLDISYVTGYGQRAFENPHHRFWAYQMSQDYPKPPAGCVSGGPNSRYQDPSVKAKIPQGTAIQKVYFDYIESWSTNEITINWNAPLAWITGYLDEKSGPVSVTITSPENGALIPSGNNVNISATVKSTQGDIINVEFYANGVLLGDDDSSPFSYEWINPTDGQYELTAKAYISGSEPVISPAIFIEVKDEVPPTVTLTAPLDNEIFEEGETVNISAIASDSDGNVVSVEFYVDDVFIGISNSTPYTAYWIASDVGSHVIKAIAIDNDNLASNPDEIPIEVTPGQSSDITIKYEYNPWNTGFTTNITITNNTDSDINDWVLTFDFENDEQITSMWNADYIQNEKSVEISTTLDWNKVIRKGESMNICGFQGTHGGVTTRPDIFYLNGIKLEIVE